MSNNHWISGFCFHYSSVIWEKGQEGMCYSPAESFLLAFSDFIDLHGNRLKHQQLLETKWTSMPKQSAMWGPNPDVDSRTDMASRQQPFSLHLACGVVGRESLWLVFVQSGVFARQVYEPRARSSLQQLVSFFYSGSGYLAQVELIAANISASFIQWQ